MKVNVVITCEEGAEWVADCKDIGLTATGHDIESALVRIQQEIREFFAQNFGSKKQIEVICSSVRASAKITVSPIDPRPEVPLYTFGDDSEPTMECLTIEGEPVLQITDGNEDE